MIAAPHAVRKLSELPVLGELPAAVDACAGVVSRREAADDHRSSGWSG